MHSSTAALSSLTSKNLNEAVNAFNAVTEQDPENTPALFDTGTTLNELGKYDEAIAVFNRLLLISPQNANALYQKGLALMHLDRYQDAQEAFRTATEYDPALPHISLNDGIALAKLGSDEEAIAAFERELALNPKNTEAATRKGISLLRLGRHADAINILAESVENDPAINGHGVTWVSHTRLRIISKMPSGLLTRFLRSTAGVPMHFLRRGKPLPASENLLKPSYPMTGPLNSRQECRDPVP